MKKTPKQQKNRKLMNHYSAWKYAVLITTVIILTLSAIPTWFGEQPSIQLTFSEQNNSEMSVVHLNQLLKTNH
ncbi:protein translocase subunit SecD, partial [Vibrio sp. Vb2880]|nr:protein translocase subunit SecD [Vibrio sp. Vb2880]